MTAHANGFNDKLDVELRHGEVQRRKDLEAALAGSRYFVADEWHAIFKKSLRALHQGNVMGFHPDYMNSRFQAYDEDKAAIHDLLVQCGTDPESFWRSVDADAMEFQLAGGESVGDYRQRILVLKREEKGSGFANQRT